MKNNLNSIRFADSAVLPPWQQLAALERDRYAKPFRFRRHPRLVLRGNRDYLRSLRAAEMFVWEAAKITFAPNQR